MLRIGRLIVAIALTACADHASSRPSVRLCNDDPNNSFTIEIRYDEDRGRFLGTFEDIGRFVEFCEPGAPCISFPVILGAPPRLPRVGEGPLRWRTGRYDFAISALNEAPGLYLIEAVEPIVSDTGRRLRQRYEVRYSATAGILSWRADGVAAGWHRCAGRLTFEDIRRLSAGSP